MIDPQQDTSYLMHMNLRMNERNEGARRARVLRDRGPAGPSVSHAAKMASLVALCMGVALPGVGARELFSSWIEEPPVVDGRAVDGAWSRTLPLALDLRARTGIEARATPATLRAVHTETHLYLLITWDDPSEDRSAGNWTWDVAEKRYRPGSSEEDSLTVSLEHTGLFDPEMSSGREAIWDVWEWGAAQTGPQGYAADRTRRITRKRPEGEARLVATKGHRPVWISRLEDGGVGVVRPLPAPPLFRGLRRPRFEPSEPSGSGADVRARGRWSEGRWVLELSRRLDTGHPDDTAFDTSRGYVFVLSASGAAGGGEGVSELIHLAFEGPGSARVDDDFELQVAGGPPRSYETGLSGKGREGRWMVREVAGAPTGRRVLVQEDADRTNYRFPVAIRTGFEAEDLELSVRFQPVSGRVDQAAGLVWRYRDPGNYYVARANALEGNVVLYKLEDGRRRDLKPVGAGPQAYGKPARVPRGSWSQLMVIARGARFQVFLNDEPLFDVEDRTFSGPGRVGLWTKADSVTRFDDFHALLY